MAGKRKNKEPIRLNRIKVVLVEKNISQIELAKKIKRNKNSMSSICNNLTQPSLKLLYQIAIALGVEVKDLLVPVSQTGLSDKQE